MTASDVSGGRSGVVMLAASLVLVELLTGMQRYLSQTSRVHLQSATVLADTDVDLAYDALHAANHKALTAVLCTVFFMPHRGRLWRPGPRLQRPDLTLRMAAFSSGRLMLLPGRWLDPVLTPGDVVGWSLGTTSRRPAVRVP